MKESTTKLTIQQKVKVHSPEEGGQKHFGKIEDIVKDMFDGSDLYLVKVRSKTGVEVKTYKAESLTAM